jgi:chemotaxis protein methyltransferase CheR
MTVSPTEFLYIKELLKEETAIVLDPGKEYLVDTRLTPLVRAAGLESISALIAAIQIDTNELLKRKVVEALTTNETSFFRDLEPFEVLRTVVLPELLERRKTTKTLNIWCAASSTGQEPYSIAMLVRECIPASLGFTVKIYATDIATNVLEKARAGKFTQHEVNRGLPATYLVKYFTKKNNDWVLKDEIRNMVQFSELNLIKPFSGIPVMDVVFIRNVLIYFDVDTKRDILARVRRVLRPDGYLFLGSAETTLSIDDKFTRAPCQRGSCFCLAQR